MLEYSLSWLESTDFGNSYNDSPMVIELEFHAYAGISQFVNFVILNDNKGILRVDILDLAFEKLRVTEQAVIVQPDNGNGLKNSLWNPRSC